MKSLKEHSQSTTEEFTPKFQRATKTDVHYTGTINGKTYVVPHSFHGSHDVLHGTKVTPMRHSIVVSPTHVQHNNPTLKPDEVARVHQHIKDIHGGQPDAKYDSFGKLEEAQRSKETPEVQQAEKTYKKEHTLKRDSFDKMEEETHSGLTPPSHAFKKAPGNRAMYDLMRKAKREKIKSERPMRKGAADRFLRRFGESEEKPVKGTPEYQAERDKYRHAALLASRKAATIAFAKKHHILNEGPMKNVFDYHKTQIAKKTLRMPDVMLGVMGGMNKEEARKHLKSQGWDDKRIHKHEHGQFAMNEHSGSEKRYNHDGSYRAGLKVTVDGKPGEISHIHHSQEHPKYPHSYKVTDTSANDPYKQTRLRGNTFISHHDIKPVNALNERTLTPAEDAKKEELVHKMKPKLQGFKARYGKDAKSVMYATATKNAKKLAEDNYDVDHMNAHICTGGEISYSLHSKGCPKAKVSTSKPIGHKIADIGPGGKEHNVKRVGPGSEKLEEAEQLNELKMPKTGFFDPDLRGVVSRVHDMGHHELKSLHKSYEKNPPQSTVQKQQHRSIKKALRNYGDPSGTHPDRVAKSKFVKKSLEEHSETFNTVKRVLRGE